MPGFLWIPTVFGVGVAVALVGWFASVSYGASHGAPRFTMAVRDGGSGADRAYGVAADAQGNVYTVGVFSGPAVLAGSPVASAGGFDGYVSKTAADGTPLWVRTFGGGSENVNGDSPLAVAVAADGGAYVTGFFSGTCAFDGETYASLGGTDLFLAKYDADGVRRWTRVGGSVADNEAGRSVAVDRDGNAYVVGEFGGGTEGAAFDGHVLTPAGGTDWALLKYDASGTLLLAERLGGGEGADAPTAVVLADDGLYVAGNAAPGASFGGIEPAAAGAQTAVALRVDVDLRVRWAVPLGAGAVNAAAASGDALYVSGTTSPRADGGAPDAFLSRIAGADGAAVWTKTIAGGGADAGRGVVADEGGVFQTGTFSGTAAVAGTVLTAAGETDGYLASFDPSTGKGRWAVAFGGAGDEAVRACASADGIVCVGSFERAASFGAFNLADAGVSDAFLFRVAEVPGSPDGKGRSIPSLGLTVRRAGETALAYAVFSPNDIPLSDVRLADPACATLPAFVNGDADADGVLDGGETWTFACPSSVTDLVGVALPVVSAEGNGSRVSAPAAWLK